MAKGGRRGNADRPVLSPMTDFDPNTEPETQEQADAYIGWCSENFMRLSQGERRTYRTSVRCAHWLLVVSCAMFHLDDDTEDDREALLEQLGMYSKLARALERQQIKLPIERLITLRSSLDCWEAIGVYASNLLDAAKMATSALMLVDLHPLVDLWELDAPDVWTLLADGASELAVINGTLDLEYADYAIRRHENVVGKFTWQRINNISRSIGARPPSPN